MKHLFKFKTFRKNSIFLCLCLIIISVLDYFNKATPYTAGEIIKKDLLLFILFFLLCFIIDVIKEKSNKHPKN